jgi:intraflagellar transport protein 52
LKDNITLEKLKKAHLLIIGGPRGYFSGEEIDIMHTYLDEGGNILVLLGEGGEEK